MYRPMFRTLSQEALIAFREKRPVEHPTNLDAEIAHIESLYSATEAELSAARVLESKMDAFEGALRELQRLIQLLKDDCPLKEQKQMMLELIGEQKKKTQALEHEAQEANRSLEQATRHTQEVTSTPLSIQFEVEESVVH